MPVLCETMIPDSYFLSKSLSVNCNYIYNTIKASQKGQEKRIFFILFPTNPLFFISNNNLYSFYLFDIILMISDCFSSCSLDILMFRLASIAWVNPSPISVCIQYARSRGFDPFGISSASGSMFPF